MANYHTYDKNVKVNIGGKMISFRSLKDDMEALRKAGAKIGIVDAGVVSIGKSVLGKEILCLKIGNKADHRVLLVGCHHAREWIAVEIPFLVGKYLIETYKTSPATNEEKRIKYMVDNSEIWIVPMTNPDGHTKTISEKKLGSKAWRANCNKISLSTDLVIERWVETKPYFTSSWRNYVVKYYKLTQDGAGRKEVEVIPAKVYEGVDLNRNYPVGAPPTGSVVPTWGTETHATSSGREGGLVEYYDLNGNLVEKYWSLSTSRSPAEPDIYCGPSAGSEPEVKAIVDLINKGNFKCCIDYHSYGQLILFPDDASLTKDAAVDFIGYGMDNLFKYRKAGYTYMSGSALYPTSGDSMSWAYRALRIPYYVVELSPNKNDAKDVTDGGKGWAFNGLPDTEIDKVFKDNLPAALAAINCSINGTTVGQRTIAAQTKNIVATPNCWKVFKGWPHP